MSKCSPIWSFFYGLIYSFRNFVKFFIIFLRKNFTLLDMTKQSILKLARIPYFKHTCFLWLMKSAFQELSIWGGAWKFSDAYSFNIHDLKLCVLIPFSSVLFWLGFTFWGLFLIVSKNSINVSKYLELWIHYINFIEKQSIF